MKKNEERKAIEFSKKYHKLHVLDGENIAKLIQVVIVRNYDLSADFLRYDTSSPDGFEERLYGSTDDEYLLLIFQGRKGLFTTLRKKNQENVDKYWSEEGQEFSIYLPTPNQ